MTGTSWNNHPARETGLYATIAQQVVPPSGKDGEKQFDSAWEEVSLIRRFESFWWYKLGSISIEIYDDWLLEQQRSLRCKGSGFKSPLADRHMADRTNG